MDIVYLEQKYNQKLAGIIPNHLLLHDMDLSEISPSDIKLPKKYIHSQLHPAFFKNEKLNPGIRKKLMKIALDFYGFLEIEAPLEDIILTGSIANYSYTLHSDIDLHLLINTENVSGELVQAYLDCKRTGWNHKHNIIIKGHEVEANPQDISEIHYATGVFSILNDSWVIKPGRKAINVDRQLVKDKIISIAHRIEAVEQTAEPAEAFERGQRLRERIKSMRKCGLEMGGEFSPENLSFKYLREKGFLERLVRAVRSSYDKMLGD